MEFRYRDGDRREQPPSRVEYRFRAGDRREQPTFIPFSGHSAPAPVPHRVELMPHGIGVGMMPHPAWREMMKEQIRQEMVSQEIAMRRELKEEVRQELRQEMRQEMEMAMARREIEEELRREMVIQPGGQIVLAPQSHMMFRPQQLMLGPLAVAPESGIRPMEVPIQANPNLRVREMDEESPISEVNQSQRPLAILRRNGVPVSGSSKFARDGEQSEATQTGEWNTLAVLKRNEGAVAGSNVLAQDGERSEVATLKRKGVVVIGSSKAARSTERGTHCALCQVSTTSETGMKEHLNGKKHLANVASLATMGTGTSNISAFVSKRSNGNTSIVRPKVAIATAVEEVPDCDAKKLTLVVNGKQHSVLKKNNLLWCELCSVRCTSTELMAAHLGGKKHLVQAGKPKACKAAKKAAIRAGAAEEKAAIRAGAVEVTAIRAAAEEEKAAIRAGAVEETAIRAGVEEETAASEGA